MASFLVPKSSEKYICHFCDYSTSRKSQYDRHILTRKHEMATNGNILVPKSSKIIFKCDCGKEYKDRSGLYKHKKKCKMDKSGKESSGEEPVLEFLLKENLEMKKRMIEITENMQTKTTNMINSNNKNFNINIFLNEDCKDAINMSEFIKSIEITVDELEKIEATGHTEGMSNILIQRLQQMDVLKRPMHCSDPNKQIIYIKDQDRWSIESSGKPKLKEAIDDITKKSLQKLPEVKDTNDPDKMVMLVGEILKDPREDKKIISKVAKSVCIP